MSENKRRTFARQHFLSWLRLREWKKTHEQLVDLARGLKLSFNEKKASYENLHRALLTGLLSFIANKTDEKNVYILAETSDAFLVRNGVEEKEITVVDNTGVPSSLMASIPQYPLIQKSDYYEWRWYHNDSASGSSSGCTCYYGCVCPYDL